MKEKMEVYEALRNEIISVEELQRNVWLHMYILYISLFVLAVEWDYHLFLVTYLVSIPYQIVINGYNWSICKVSSYIRIFFEEEYQGINWESLHVYDPYKKYYDNKQKTIIDRIKYTGSIQLGIIATVAFLFYLIQEILQRNSVVISIIDIVWGIFSLVLLVVTILVNKDYFERQNEEIEKIIRPYKSFTKKKDNSLRDCEDTSI